MITFLLSFLTSEMYAGIKQHELVANRIANLVKIGSWVETTIRRILNNESFKNISYSGIVLRNLLWKIYNGEKIMICRNVDERLKASSFK